MGPNSYTPKGQALLGYHLTVNREGRITRVVPDFDYPKGDLGNPWDVTERYPIQTVADFARNLDFDALSIHTPKEQNMSSTKQRILQLLSLGPHTSFSLSLNTGVPQPSIRRSVATLRLDGYDIITRGGGRNAEYVLENTAGQVSALEQVRPAQSLADDLKDEYAAPEYHEDSFDHEDDLDDFFGVGYDDDIEEDPFDSDLD